MIEIIKKNSQQISYWRLRVRKRANMGARQRRALAGSKSTQTSYSLLDQIIKIIHIIAGDVPELFVYVHTYNTEKEKMSHPCLIFFVYLW